MASISTAATSKRYTRSELFELAESMNDENIDREQLNKFKETKLIYNLNLVEYPVDEVENFGLRPKLYRTLSNQQGFGRTLSNLQKIPERISRMTSSPSLKYNRNHKAGASDVERMMMQKGGTGDPISSQARAKYAELIDNYTSSPSSSSSLMGSQTSNSRQLVSRSTSLNVWHTDYAARRHAERPSNLFGSLKQDVNFSRHDLRDSEEPLSLPYVLTNNSSGKKSSSLMKDSSHSPIKRNGSSGNPPSADTTSAGNQDNEIEDDDFDLDSMINITVLSDIKTIRQDFHSHQQQQQHSSLPQQNMNRHRLAGTKHRDYNKQSQDQRSIDVRPLLTRSRTATEFTYRGRYQQPSQLSPANHRLTARVGTLDRNSPASKSSYQPACYDSIPCTYSWQYNDRRPGGSSGLSHESKPQQLTRQASEGSSLTLKSKNQSASPQEEKAAKIIETFKAQVLARAASSDLSADNSKRRDDQREASEKATEKATISRDPPDTTDQNDAKTTSKDISGSKLDEPSQVDEKAEPKLIESVEKGKDPTEEQSTQRSLKAPATIASSISNIPRLISLHSKAASSKSNESPAVKTETTTETRTPETSDKRTSTITKSTALSSKFVSQYRQLRGRSLADELGEQSSAK